MVGTGSLRRRRDLLTAFAAETAAGGQWGAAFYAVRRNFTCGLSAFGTKGAVRRQRRPAGGAASDILRLKGRLNRALRHPGENGTQCGAYAKIHSRAPGAQILSGLFQNIEAPALLVAVLKNVHLMPAVQHLPEFTHRRVALRRVDGTDPEVHHLNTVFPEKRLQSLTDPCADFREMGVGL